MAGALAAAHLRELVAAVVAVSEGACGGGGGCFQVVAGWAGGACGGDHGLVDAPPACVQLPGGAALGGAVACEAVLAVVGPGFCAGATVVAWVGAARQVGTEAGATVGGAQGFGGGAGRAVAVGVVGVCAAADGSVPAPGLAWVLLASVATRPARS